MTYLITLVEMNKNSDDKNYHLDIKKW